MSEETRPKRTAVGAWITYDIANTVFWTGVVGLSFPLWLTNELSGDDATLGYTLAAAMTVVLVTAPIIGAISDQIGRKMPLLVASTLICIAATLFLGNGGLFISLALFALALASMELGAIFYNSLLHNVSTEDNRGMISGLGTGIGYLGSFIAVGIALGFTDSRGYVFVMQVVAFLFLLFALPIFFPSKRAENTGVIVNCPQQGQASLLPAKRQSEKHPPVPGPPPFPCSTIPYTEWVSTPGLPSRWSTHPRP